ncbi:MAG: Fe-Mn family superoxide dismutase [Pseudomonadota bacterium]
MKQFKVEPFGGLSAAAIKAHLELYKGYSEQTDAVLRQLDTPPPPTPLPATLTPRETLARRLSFEGNGAILHELFFEQLESPGNGEDPAFSIALAQRYGSFEKWQEDVLELGTTRGPGWVLTCLHRDSLIENFWIDLHELGAPAGSAVLYAMDLWEHAYWTDYGAKGREKYMRDLFGHSNWAIAGKRYQQAQRGAG